MEGSKVIYIKTVETAMGFMRRAIGLMPRKIIPHDYAMLFEDCNAVHTFFMKAFIDVVMVDKDNAVIYVKEKVAPYGFAGCAAAKRTYEFAAGEVRLKNIQKGDIIRAYEEKK